MLSFRLHGGGVTVRSQSTHSVGRLMVEIWAPRATVRPQASCLNSVPQLPDL